MIFLNGSVRLIQLFHILISIYSLIHVVEYCQTAPTTIEGSIDIELDNSVYTNGIDAFGVLTVDKPKIAITTSHEFKLYSVDTSLIQDEIDDTQHNFHVFSTTGISSSSTGGGILNPPLPPIIGSATLLGSGMANVTFQWPYSYDPTLAFIVTTLPDLGVSATGRTSPITISGLADGVDYSFVVRAVNGSGTSDYSISSSPIKIGDVRLPMRMIVDYNSTCGPAVSANTVRAFYNQMSNDIAKALNCPSDRIKVLYCTPGSTIVSTSIVPSTTGTPSPVLADQLATLIATPGSAYYQGVYTSQTDTGYPSVPAITTSDVDYCADNPCANGGFCVRSPIIPWACRCNPGFYGAHCNDTTPVLPCATNPCLNGGICQPVASQAVCSCLFPYTGSLCASTSVDPSTLMTVSMTIHLTTNSSGPIDVTSLTNALAATSDVSASSLHVSSATAVNGALQVTYVISPDPSTNLSAQAIASNINTAVSSGNFTNPLGKLLASSLTFQSFCADGTNGSVCQGSTTPTTTNSSSTFPWWIVFIGISVTALLIIFAVFAYRRRRSQHQSMKVHSIKVKEKWADSIIPNESNGIKKLDESVDPINSFSKKGRNSRKSAQIANAAADKADFLDLPTAEQLIGDIRQFEAPTTLNTTNAEFMTPEEAVDNNDQLDDVPVASDLTDASITPKRAVSPKSRNRADSDLPAPIAHFSSPTRARQLSQPITSTVIEKPYTLPTPDTRRQSASPLLVGAEKNNEISPRRSSLLVPLPMEVPSLPELPPEPLSPLDSIPFPVEEMSMINSPSHRFSTSPSHRFSTTHRKSMRASVSFNRNVPEEPVNQQEQTPAQDSLADFVSPDDFIANNENTYQTDHSSNDDNNEELLASQLDNNTPDHVQSIQVSVDPSPQIDAISVSDAPIVEQIAAKPKVIKLSSSSFRNKVQLSQEPVPETLESNQQIVKPNSAGKRTLQIYKTESNSVNGTRSTSPQPSDSLPTLPDAPVTPAPSFKLISKNNNKHTISASPSSSRRDNKPKITIALPKQNDTTRSSQASPVQLVSTADLPTLNDITSSTSIRVLPTPKLDDLVTAVEMENVMGRLYNAAHNTSRHNSNEPQTVQANESSAVESDPSPQLELRFSKPALKLVDLSSTRVTSIHSGRSHSGRGDLPQTSSSSSASDDIVNIPTSPRSISLASPKNSQSHIVRITPSVRTPVRSPEQYSERLSLVQSDAVLTLDPTNRRQNANNVHVIRNKTSQKLADNNSSFSLEPAPEPITPLPAPTLENIMGPAPLRRPSQVPPLNIPSKSSSVINITRDQNSVTLSLVSSHIHRAAHNILGTAPTSTPSSTSTTINRSPHVPKLTISHALPRPITLISSSSAAAKPVDPASTDVSSTRNQRVVIPLHQSSRATGQKRIGFAQRNNLLRPLNSHQNQ